MTDNHHPIHTVDVDETERLLRLEAIERLRQRRNFWIHVTVHLLGTLVIVTVWAITEYHNAGGWPTGLRTGRHNRDWDPWVIYPVAAGTLALTVHGWITFGLNPPTEHDIARTMEQIRIGN